MLHTICLIIGISGISAFGAQEIIHKRKVWMNQRKQQHSSKWLYDFGPTEVNMLKRISERGR